MRRSGSKFLRSDTDAAYEETLRGLDDQRLLRKLHPVCGESGHVRVHDVDGRALISFSSNDYLGLAHHPKVKGAAIDATEVHGVGSGASRLITGTHPVHLLLEEAIAEFKGVKAALTFANGYAAASGFATAFLSRKSIVILDKLSHASLIDSCRLSGAKVLVFRHNDLDKLEALLRWADGQPDKDRVVIMTESIFSMDGDLAPLAEIVSLKDRYGAQLLLDEAHGVGVIGAQGRGLAADLNLTDRIDYHMGTLGKALGVAGGYLAGSQAMVDILINKARSFIYSTAPPPILAVAARSALEIATGKEGEERREILRGLMARLAEETGQPESPAAIFPYQIGDEAAALAQAFALQESGFYVPAIRYPTVARGAARLRLTLTADHTCGQIQALTRAMADYAARHGAV